MNNADREPIQYTCEYCGSKNTHRHTYDCKLAQVPWLFADGRVMPAKNRKALADLVDAVRLYKQK